MACWRVALIKIGLIGCGAAVQIFHLPAILQTPGVMVHWIVEPQVERVSPIANRLKVPHYGTNYMDVADVDAVIIATPHFLHFPMAEHFLSQGVHVLCEKPLALNTSDALSLVNLAARKKCHLAVGVYRRFYPVSAFMKQVITTDWLGELVRIDIEEGGSYDWDLQSRFMLEKEKAGGGVLVDTGSHTLDRALWLLDARRVTIQHYADNCRGGLETDCELDLSIPWRGHDIPLHMELSRTRLLKNSFDIQFEHGRLSVPANHPSNAVVVDERLSSDHDQNFRNSFHVDTAKDFDLPGEGQKPYFIVQFQHFCEAIIGNGTLMNSGESVLTCIQTIESCYSNREMLSETWANMQNVNDRMKIGEII